MNRMTGTSLDRFATAAFMIVNRQRNVRVSVEDLGEFVSRARRALRLPVESVTVCLVTNSEIARWNRTYRGKRGTNRRVVVSGGCRARKPGDTEEAKGIARQP